ncbi:MULTISPECIES: acetyl-CoA carboxylase biotin carboxyl carrier protein [unclassified Beijerinckia]|uniref:acetyl-CoA carboxylase biotin carboxyl carrier protein n=1 Tax=unclassified Beijerinckia TaxID=2638183 RepID=UPI00089537CE|nr:MULTISPECIES: acetyl-CoA carboxylase biotin carboxyl carrier protein [unclassified Beijerinckia]MDH7794853.1 acetyl-CoA carboxylase biotin carboxyl carrier protein [Beijerinckia sp. GAS462]SEB77827.1 acetyl-CoA carboxylase biotin carboxyl carrier protein [Beijerinckia sp. 28-YEA-48]
MTKKPEDEKPRFDTSLVEELGAILGRLELSEIEVEHEGMRVRVSRQPPTVIATAAPTSVIAPPPLPIATPAAATPAAAPVEHPGTVKSPMVGTAYRRPSPDSKPFVEIGSVVKEGEKILLVEAMKTFNEIVAPRAGTITALFVDDGQPVEYGAPLLVIE